MLQQNLLQKDSPKACRRRLYNFWDTGGTLRLYWAGGGGCAETHSCTVCRKHWTCLFDKFTKQRFSSNSSIINCMVGRLTRTCALFLFVHVRNTISHSRQQDPMSCVLPSITWLLADFVAPLCVYVCLSEYAEGLGGLSTHPVRADVLSEASSQPFSSAVPQCSAAPQCLWAGLLRAGPQHSAALR